MAVRCATVMKRPEPLGRRHLAVTAAAAGVMLLAGCGSGDSTVSKTPEASPPTAAPPPAATAQPSPPKPSATPTAAPDPCAVNLAPPEIPKTVSELPRDPRSGQAWRPVPLPGTSNEWGQLSATIMKANS